MTSRRQNRALTTTRRWTTGVLLATALVTGGLGAHLAETYAATQATTVAVSTSGTTSSGTTSSGATSSGTTGSSFGSTGSVGSSSGGASTTTQGS